MRTRAQLEAEAEELFPTDDTTYISIHMDDLNGDLQRAFIKGRTVTAEQLVAAAWVMHNLQSDTLWGESRSEREADIKVQKEAFRAAGFYVVEDDDEHQSDRK